MTEFSTYTPWKSVKEQNLKAVSCEVSERKASNNRIFEKPLELLEKWKAMPGDVPHFKNIDPVKIGADMLPILFILDVIEQEDAAPDFKWRLFGTKNTQRYGIEATGYRLSKAMHLDASIAQSLRLARLVYHTHEPRFMETHFVKKAEIVYQASTIILPLSDDSGKVVRLFGCTDWH
ncbi:PAS domain-containing protein [Kordiimonas aquimaris]|uniref:PAS domain-containing protein n=1 Tax=Kordiimonas aquimaris TaxID=707591 RepID=UPI0021D2387D|nr:PAS domain-containing protein [Kordiimonas aquimaris]